MAKDSLISRDMFDLSTPKHDSHSHIVDHFAAAVRGRTAPMLPETTSKSSAHACLQSQNVCPPRQVRSPRLAKREQGLRLAIIPATAYQNCPWAVGLELLRSIALPMLEAPPKFSASRIGRQSCNLQPATPPLPTPPNAPAKSLVAIYTALQSCSTSPSSPSPYPSALDASSCCEISPMFLSSFLRRQ